MMLFEPVQFQRVCASVSVPVLVHRCGMDALEGDDEERMVVMTTESEQKEVMELLLGGAQVIVSPFSIVFLLHCLLVYYH